MLKLYSLENIDYRFTMFKLAKVLNFCQLNKFLLSKNTFFLRNKLFMHNNLNLMKWIRLFVFIEKIYTFSFNGVKKITCRLNYLFNVLNVIMQKLLFYFKKILQQKFKNITAFKSLQNESKSFYGKINKQEKEKIQNLDFQIRSLISREINKIKLQHKFLTKACLDLVGVKNLYSLFFFNFYYNFFIYQSQKYNNIFECDAYEMWKGLLIAKKKFYIKFLKYYSLFLLNEFRYSNVFCTSIVLPLFDCYGYIGYFKDFLTKIFFFNRQFTQLSFFMFIKIFFLNLWYNNFNFVNTKSLLCSKFTEIYKINLKYYNDVMLVPNQFKSKVIGSFLYLFFVNILKILLKKDRNIFNNLLIRVFRKYFHFIWNVNRKVLFVNTYISRLKRIKHLKGIK